MYSIHQPNNEGNKVNIHSMVQQYALFCKFITLSGLTDLSWVNKDLCPKIEFITYRTKFLQVK
jgi:hypothetical protein